MSQEKMLLNDVAGQTTPTHINEIEKIIKHDDYEQIPILIDIPYYLLKEFINVKEKDRAYNNIIINLLSNFTTTKQQHTTSSFLSYEGKEPRKDVLVKLLKIANELEDLPMFPNFKRNYLEKIIRQVLRNPDHRTVDKYLNSLRDFAEKVTGKPIIFYGDYYLFDLKDAITTKLDLLVRNKEIE